MIPNFEQLEDCCCPSQMVVLPLAQYAANQNNLIRELVTCRIVLFGALKVC